MFLLKKEKNGIKRGAQKKIKIIWFYYQLALPLSPKNRLSMKIAIIGYGKMGHVIEQIALQRGHTIVSTIDIHNQDEFETNTFRSADVAIEFTMPSTAYHNFQRCFAAGVPVVSGTTGWTSRLEDIIRQCKEEGKTFFYASNFSIGVNIFFALNRYLAKLMNHFPAYDVNMTEIHHIHKLDAPSGTAITLAEGILNEIDRKKEWRLKQEKDIYNPDELTIQALREDEVSGIHEIQYESEVDSLTIKHEAKSRAGFALGAVLAAEFTAGKKGFFQMSDLLKVSGL